MISILYFRKIKFLIPPLFLSQLSLGVRGALIVGDDYALKAQATAIANLHKNKQIATSTTVTDDMQRFHQVKTYFYIYKN